MIDFSVLVHYRTEEAKAFRREHGDRGGSRKEPTAQTDSQYRDNIATRLLCRPSRRVGNTTPHIVYEYE